MDLPQELPQVSWLIPAQSQAQAQFILRTMSKLDDPWASGDISKAAQPIWA